MEQNKKLELKAGGVELISSLIVQWVTDRA